VKRVEKALREVSSLRGTEGQTVRKGGTQSCGPTGCDYEKGKPVARRGRKATGLSETAGLP